MLEDVRGGFVGAEAARALYGVAIADGAVDGMATQRLRADRLAPAGLFHRREYADHVA